jgi:hypothetical protein
MLWNDEHCSSRCMLSLIQRYLDNKKSKCIRTASCMLMKVLAVLWCGRQILEIISSFFSLLLKSGFSFHILYCSSSCTLSLIRQYLNNVKSKNNQIASCVLMKVLAVLWCGGQFLEIISSFFSVLSKSRFSFCNL